MDERIRQRQLEDVDAGMAPQEVLQRVAAATREQRDEALAALSAIASDEEILELVGLDMAELRREIDWDGVWSLP